MICFSQKLFISVNVDVLLLCWTMRMDQDVYRQEYGDARALGFAYHRLRSLLRGGIRLGNIQPPVLLQLALHDQLSCLSKARLESGGFLALQGAL